MLKKEKLDDVLCQINICRGQLIEMISKICEEHSKLITIYQSNVIYCENIHDRSFIEGYHKGQQQLSNVNDALLDIYSLIEREAIDSANSWFEIIPTAFK